MAWSFIKARVYLIEKTMGYRVVSLSSMDTQGRTREKNIIPLDLFLCLKNIWERLGQLDACFTNKPLKPNCGLAWFRIAAVKKPSISVKHIISWNIYMICFPARALQQNLHKQREERFLPIFQSHEYLAFKKAEGAPSWLLQPRQPRRENIWQLSTLSQEHLSASCLWHVVAIQCPIYIKGRWVWWINVWSSGSFHVSCVGDVIPGCLTVMCPT